MKLILGLVAAIIIMVGLFGWTMYQESQADNEMSLLLAENANRQHNELMHAKYQVESLQQDIVDAGLRMWKLENDAEDYRAQYKVLDLHFNEYLKKIPASTVSKSDIEATSDNITLHRSGEYWVTHVYSSGSMRPILEHDFVILLEKVNDIDDVRVGDIAVYQREDGHLIIHRIIDDAGDRWIFRGDANLYDDPPVPKEYVVWRLVAIFY